MRQHFFCLFAFIGVYGALHGLPFSFFLSFITTYLYNILILSTSRTPYLHIAHTDALAHKMTLSLFSFSYVLSRLRYGYAFTMGCIIRIICHGVNEYYYYNCGIGAELHYGVTGGQGFLFFDSSVRRRGKRVYSTEVYYRNTYYNGIPKFVQCLELHLISVL